jgi:hypothetical protein
VLLRTPTSDESVLECFYNKDGKWYYAGTYKAFRMDDLTTQEWEALSTEVKPLMHYRAYRRLHTATFTDNPSHSQGDVGRPQERVASESLRNGSAICSRSLACGVHRTAMRGL